MRLRVWRIKRWCEKLFDTGGRARQPLSSRTMRHQTRDEDFVYILGNGEEVEECFRKMLVKAHSGVFVTLINDQINEEKIALSPIIEAKILEFHLKTIESPIPSRNTNPELRLPSPLRCPAAQEPDTHSWAFGVWEVIYCSSTPRSLFFLWIKLARLPPLSKAQSTPHIRRRLILTAQPPARP